MALTGINAVKKYAGLFREKREIEQRLKALEPGMKELEGVVIDYFQKHGVDRQAIDGTTVYLRRELWAGREEAIENDAACAALVAAGLPDYVEPRFNTMKLSAYVRELDKQDEHADARDRKPGDAFFESHPGTRGVIKVSEVFKVGARNS